MTTRKKFKTRNNSYRYENRTLVNNSDQSYIDWKDDYDVALIKLKTPFEIGLPFVNPACLPIADKFKDETKWDGERLNLVGKYFCQSKF